MILPCVEMNSKIFPTDAFVETTNGIFFVTGHFRSPTFEFFVHYIMTMTKINFDLRQEVGSPRNTTISSIFQHAGLQCDIARYYS